MKSTIAGSLIGLGVAALLGASLWAGGWLRLGTMNQDARTSRATDMAAISNAADDGQADHDMAAMEPPTESAPVAGAPIGDAAAVPAGAVMITPERQQLIGVRTAVVVAEEVTRTLRTVGKVEYDETRVAHIHTRVSGWIEKLHVDFTGKLVEKGQPLLDIYSPELVATQEEYLLALRAQESLGSSAYPEVANTTRSLLEATRRRLRLWHVTDAQIATLEETREPGTTLTIFSPIVGFVIHKAAYEGQHVGPDSELFTIADLSEVWVTADVYESELPYVRVGQRATISLSYLPGEKFRGLVDYVYPYLTGETRTATVRVVLPNSGLTLKPDMYANVELVARLGRSLVVPEDAVIDTGTRQVVFVILPGGHFLARDVTPGMRFDDKLQILDGLEEGDVVAARAAFLIDSESKLRSAVGGMMMMEHD